MSKLASAFYVSSTLPSPCDHGEGGAQALFWEDPVKGTVMAAPLLPRPARPPGQRVGSAFGSRQVQTDMLTTARNLCSGSTAKGPVRRRFHEVPGKCPRPLVFPVQSEASRKPPWLQRSDWIRHTPMFFTPLNLPSPILFPFLARSPPGNSIPSGPPQAQPLPAPPPGWVGAPLG